VLLRAQRSEGRRRRLMMFEKKSLILLVELTQIERATS